MLTVAEAIVGTWASPAAHLRVLLRTPGLSYVG